VSVLHAVLIILAGIAAGTINTIVGSGTLVTFPVLLALGLPPVTANTSNTVGLFPGAFVGAYGYRRELRGQVRRAVFLGAASVTGGVAGAVMLLVLPAVAFNATVPALIILALVLVVIGPRLSAWMKSKGHERKSEATPALWLLTMFTGVYGGYFGAAQGVLLMGFFGLSLTETLQRQNALKNVLAGLVNMVAAAVFVATANIDWAAAGLLVAGSVIGGTVGARAGRRLPPIALRSVIVCIGIAAAIKFLVLAGWSAPGIDRDGAVGCGGVEVQQHRLCLRLDDSRGDVVPGEGADRLGRLPERVRGQLNGAVLAEVTAQQVRAGEAGQLAQLVQQCLREVAAVVVGARPSRCRRPGPDGQFRRFGHVRHRGAPRYKSKGDLSTA